MYVQVAIKIKGRPSPVLAWFNQKRYALAAIKRFRKHPEFDGAEILPRPRGWKL